MALRRTAFQLFCLGFLTLFLELALIRYLAANIWNLGYFPNLVLMATFIGMGIGFLFHQVSTEEKSRCLFSCSAVLLAILVLFVFFFHPSVPGFVGLLGDFKGEIFFTHSGEKEHSYLPFLMSFFLAIGVFALISQRTAKLFRQFAPLHAYSLDIAGSCAGILALMIISFLQVAAWIWFLALVGLYVLAADTAATRAVAVVALLVVVGVVRFQDSRMLGGNVGESLRAVAWSPYQKLELSVGGPYSFVYSNGISHQSIVSREQMEDRVHPLFYTAPYVERMKRHLPPYKRVLVLGSGTGNDVLAALVYGAQHIDAVEIDPAVYALGKQYASGHQYDDPRVTVILDDGRVFLQHAHQPYDLIVFAQTDSLVKVSDRAELRLENFLYTENAVRRAHALLTPDGDLLFYKNYRRPFIVEKIEQMIFDVDGYYPSVIWKHDDFYLLVAGAHNASPSPPLPLVSSADVPTDDWPFLYVRSHALPSAYFLPIGIVLSIVAVLMFAQIRLSRRSTEEASLATKLAFALMGSAFLLLETKSIVQFSLLFGTTWLNNSLVFLSILVLVLAANWTAAALRIRSIWPIYTPLLIACFLPLIVPLDSLLHVENPVSRGVLAALMVFSPIYFANLMFSVAFRHQKTAEHVFGWNLLGATVGGLLEYGSLIVGYQAQAKLVVVLYTACAVCLSLDKPKGTQEPLLSLPVGDAPAQM